MGMPDTILPFDDSSHMLTELTTCFQLLELLVSPIEPRALA